MRRRSLLIGGLAVGATSTASAAERRIVLELFTSQGCSSCPPADALLGELAQRSEVVALAWHVDYWNNLGWNDPFAKRQWTERQRSYAKQLRDEVYTPGLVVNGAAMLVGSDRAAVYNAIRRAPELPVRVELRRTAEGLQGTIDEMPAGAGILLAVYDPEIATSVGSGENGGRRLREFRVVRELRELSIEGGRQQSQLIAETQGAALLVQAADGRVLGAADIRPS
jgi:hypothetical protein